jgi:DNA polymerase-3 subunit delta'
MSNLYTWQKSTWQQVQQSRARLPHAILFYGQSGIGKVEFAKTLSQALLCKTPTPEGHACQTCNSCHWFKDEAHPDFRVLSPEEGSADEATSSKKKTKKKQNISIAQVRALSDFVNLTSHNEQGLRIILIQPAETLNVASANALLKMLEEPANNAIFILVSHQLQRLLPTILSRCHKIAMPMPTAEESVSWLTDQGVDHAKAQLAYYANSPMRVRDEAINFPALQACWQLLGKGKQLEPAVTANKLIAQSVDAGLITFQKWLYDIVALKNTGDVRYHQSELKQLQALASKVNLTALFDLQKKIESLRKLATHPLNHELQLEVLLLEYTKIFL